MNETKFTSGKFPFPIFLQPTVIVIKKMFWPIVGIGCTFNILVALRMEIFCFCAGMSSFELPVSKI
jgi:hypothetical protein